LYGIEREFDDSDDEQRFIRHQVKNVPVLDHLPRLAGWIQIFHPCGTVTKNTCHIRSSSDFARVIK